MHGGRGCFSIDFAPSSKLDPYLPDLANTKATSDKRKHTINTIDMISSIISNSISINIFHIKVFLPSILEIKFTAVKFKMISMTFDEFTTNTNELKIAIDPCMKRRRQEKSIRRVLSSMVAVSNRGNVSTAVHNIISVVIRDCI